MPDAPQPTLILHLAKRTIVEMVELPKTPQWAKALVAAAVKILEVRGEGRRLVLLCPCFQRP